MNVSYELGPFRLDPEAGALTHAGKPVGLGSRAVAVLGALVERANEYVTKASLIEAAWPDVIVEEANLAVQISSIRRVLAQVPGGEHWVETLARRGYRFVGPVIKLSDGAPKRSGGEHPHSNLPAALTSFVGRERELVEIKRLLPRTRLLTLVGIGGIGKTRLALQAAAEVVDAYRDGVWFVDLAPLAGAALVPSAVAQVLAVRETAGTPLVETLCSHAKGRQLLLVLDNCEHLLAGCATLAEALLRAGAEVSIIATSREPLRVAGEQTYPLATLSLPDPAASAETIGRSEAVQLFVERAEMQQPGFTLADARAGAIAQLCIHLDGIPLALELAAARIRTLSIDEINARLGDRFRLLTGGSRTALPRQQTLRATLDWSHDLLAEQERVVLRRLAIFPGSFTLEAASAVASDEAIDQFTVVDLLSRLVARSLLAADTNDANTRYRLLETMRAYALEKLAQAGETNAMARRHALFFRERLENAHDDWLRLPGERWQANFLPERDNIRAGLIWAFDSGGDTAVGIALACASGPMWMELSLRREGLERLEAAAVHVDSQTPESEQARLWLWLGMLLGDGDPAQSVPIKERAIEYYRRVGDAYGLGFSLAELALPLIILGRFDQAGKVLGEASSLLENSGLPRALARHSETLGLLETRTGNPRNARDHFEKALSLYRKTGLRREELRMLGNLAELTWTLGDLDAALARFREVIELSRNSPLTTRTTLGFSLTNLAGLLAERGELDEALAAAREGLPLLRQGGVAWVNMDHFALLAALAGDIERAARIAGYADSIHAAKQASRGPNETRACNRLRAMLRENYGPEEIDSLVAEGAMLTEDEACQLALEN